MNEEEKKAIEYYQNKEVSFSVDFYTENLLKAFGITEEDSFENHQIRFKTLLNLIEKLKKENEELKKDRNNNYRMIALAQNEALGYMQGYEDGKKSKRSAVAYIVENQQYYILNKQIEHYKEYIKKLQKENEKFKKERQIVGIPVRNKRDGRIGIVLHQWESGSVAVLESINPRVINTHDSWNTLEIVTDEVKDGNDTNVDSI